jgi:hypothetical protein
MRGKGDVSQIYEINDTFVGPFTLYENDTTALKEYMKKVDSIEV